MKLAILSREKNNYSTRRLVEACKARGHEVIDLGPNTKDRVDYPVYSKLMATKIQANPESSQGILICGSVPVQKNISEASFSAINFR